MVRAAATIAVVPLMMARVPGIRFRIDPGEVPLVIKELWDTGAGACVKPRNLAEGLKKHLVGWSSRISMRTVAGLTALFLLVIVAASPMTALAQQVIERPSYAAGDSWTYDVVLREIPELNETEDLVLNVNVTGLYTITIEGLEEVEIGGESVMAYNATRVLEITISGTVEIGSEEFSVDASVSGTVTVNDQLYMAQEGLEILTIDTSLEIDIEMSAIVEDIELTLPVIGSGSTEGTIDYVADSWSFPYELGDEGSEEASTMGSSSFEFTFFGNTTESSGEFSSNSTMMYEAVSEETVTVGAGTFDTLVVETKVGPEDDELPVEVALVIGPQLSYWASHVGAPVKQEILDSSGTVIVEFNLTSYRYQAAERLTILGLDVIYWIPIVAVIAGGVIVVVFLRRKPPVVE